MKLYTNSFLMSTEYPAGLSCPCPMWTRNALTPNHPTTGIWLILTNSRMLTVKIYIGTLKKAACLSAVSLHVHPPPSFHPVRIAGFTKMRRWLLGPESTIFSGHPHLNKPLSFSQIPVSGVWLLLRQAVEPVFSFNFISVLWDCNNISPSGTGPYKSSSQTPLQWVRKMMWAYFSNDESH